MSMSTKIDDLPGPLPENMKTDVVELQGQIDDLPSSYQIHEDNQSNIQASISKKLIDADEQTKQTFFTIVQREVSEENLLILLLIVLASLPSFQNLITKVPFLNNKVLSGSFAFSAVVGIILLITFIVFKRIVLPNVRI